MDSELVLMGLFRHLKERGFPLGIRDYRDALTALEKGAGTLDRTSLLWLCRTLWARTDEEVVSLERLFGEFPRPAEPETGEWQPRAEEPYPLGDRPDTLTEERPVREVPEARFEAAGHTGAGLPRAVLPAGVNQRFVYTARPLVSPRSLVICWRRFRRARRAGPRVVLDVAATIEEKCRTGALRAPVFSALQQNQASVLVLADASASMAPWAGIFQLLEESLAESRLRWAKLLYFENVPSEEVYETDSFLHPVNLPELLRGHPDAALMVIGDAGAARGRRGRKRAESTVEFLRDVSAGRAVAWLNPMPQARWAGTAAEQIARFSRLSMSELNEEGMLAAIDAMRGLKDVA